MGGDDFPGMLIAGGGTGGHIFIGVALAEEWKRRVPGGRVLFVGARGRLEEQLVPEAGLDLELLNVSRLKGASPLRLAAGLLRLPGALLRSVRLVRRFRPCVAAGVGGYASGPAVLGAVLAGVPALIVEPNARPGLTNRLLARVVGAVAAAFPESGRWFGPKMRLTGVPVRGSFLAQPPAREGFLLAILGGSQGSRALNAAAASAVPLLRQDIPGLRVVHQTGAAEYGRYRALHSDWWTVAPFVENMADLMGRASVIVCRAGASTIAEIAAVGRCAVLVPYPHASDDHQMRNARALQESGAARLLAEESLSGEALAAEVLDLYRQPGVREAVERAAARLARRDSARLIVDMALEMARLRV